MPSPSELRAIAERAKRLAKRSRFQQTYARMDPGELSSLASALIDLLAENERLRSENAYLRTNGTELAP